MKLIEALEIADIEKKWIRDSKHSWNKPRHPDAAPFTRSDMLSETWEVVPAHYFGRFDMKVPEDGFSLKLPKECHGKLVEIIIREVP